MRPIFQPPICMIINGLKSTVCYYNKFYFIVEIDIVVGEFYITILIEGYYQYIEIGEQDV